MGIKERRARQKTSLRQDILDAARQMFAEEGYDRVSMRRLAERIEYSPTAIYLHFEDKDDLFKAVCEETFSKLVQRLKKQRQQLSGQPLACLKAGLREYIDFALKHPEHYIVTFMHRDPAEAGHHFEGSAGEEAFGYLQQAVTDCMAANLFRPMRAEITAQVLWMSIHGLASLLIAKKGFPFAPRTTLIDEQIATLVGGLLK